MNTTSYTNSPVQSSLEYTYLVRAAKLNVTGGGSFYHLSRALTNRVVIP